MSSTEGLKFCSKALIKPRPSQSKKKFLKNKNYFNMYFSPHPPHLHTYLSAFNFDVWLNATSILSKIIFKLLRGSVI